MSASKKTPEKDSWDTNKRDFFFEKVSEQGKRCTWACKMQKLTQLREAGTNAPIMIDHPEDRNRKPEERRKIEASEVYCIQTIKVMNSSGYSNFKSHLQSCCGTHFNFDDFYKAKDTGNIDIRKFVTVDTVSADVHEWLLTVIRGNFAFSYVDNADVRRNSKLRPLSSKALVKYIDAAAYEVECTLAKIVPDRFAIIFDGWDAGRGTALTGVYVSWYDTKTEAVKKYLLRLAKLNQLNNFTADNHARSIASFLGRINKTWDNVVAVIGDNTSTNIAIADKMTKPFIGCLSHRLNLAVKAYRDSRALAPLLLKVHKLMKMLRRKKNIGRLETLGCHYKPEQNHEIRWSAEFKMLTSLKRIREYLRDPVWDAVPSLKEKIPSEAEYLTLLGSDFKNADGKTVVIQRGLFHEYKNFHKASMILQSDDMSLIECTAVIEYLSVHYAAQTGEYLQKTYVKEGLHRDFQQGVMKIQNKSEDTLSPAEREAVKSLLQADAVQEEEMGEEEDEDSNLCFEQVAKAARYAQVGPSRYINPDFLLPTSNICERTFSTGKKIWRPERKSMKCERFEAVMMLKCNQELWSSSSIINKIRNTPRMLAALDGAGAALVANAEAFDNDAVDLPAQFLLQDPADDDSDAELDDESDDESDDDDDEEEKNDDDN
jgi:hypothetical protein